MCVRTTVEQVYCFQLLDILEWQREKYENMIHGVKSKMHLQLDDYIYENSV